MRRSVPRRERWRGLVYTHGWVAAVVPIALLLALPYISDPGNAGYDGANHLFFIDHYRHDWWGPWERRWFGGFFVYSYPPLAHQLVALLSFGTGEETAWRIAQWGVLLSCIAAAGLCAREVFGVRGASHVAVLASTFTGLYLFVFTWGQVPAMLALGLMLTASAFLARYLRCGERLDLVAWAGLAGATVAAHHHTATVAFPVAALTAALTQIMRGRVTALPRREFVRRLWWAGVVGGVATATVALPFLWWLGTQSLPQTEIPHPSRGNLFANQGTLLLFFAAIWGGALALLPTAVWESYHRVDLWPAAAAMLLFGMLGLGTGTALPRILFPTTWRWLIYDRFSLWAALFCVLIVGTWIDRVSMQLGSRVSLVAALTLIGAATMHAAHAQLILQEQPPEVLTSLRAFLDQDDHADWAYITVGLGEDAFVKLTRLTRAPSVDASYFTARRDPVLRESGITTLDTALNWPDGTRTLQRVLAAPAHFGLRWGVSGTPAARDQFAGAGWQLVQTVPNPATVSGSTPAGTTITIWQSPAGDAAPTVASVTPPPPASPWLFRPLWGILPLTLLANGMVAGMRSLLRGRPEVSAFERMAQFVGY